MKIKKTQKTKTKKKQLSSDFCHPLSKTQKDYFFCPTHYSNRMVCSGISGGCYSADLTIHLSTTGAKFTNPLGKNIRIKKLQVQ